MVSGTERPVPLSHSYVLTPLHETLDELLSTRQSPVYVVHFTQAAALERAQALMSTNVATREQKDAIAAHIGGFRFTSGFGKTLSRLVRHGIGVHHAGMLPRYRRLVEQLAQAGLLKVICGTDTLGVGINVPIRTVVLTGLTKYDGHRQRRLNAREFHQIAGRAGRAGYDTSGYVIVAGARARHRERARAGQGGRRPEEAAQGAAQEGTRGSGHLVAGDVRAPGRGRAGAAAEPPADHALVGAQRDQPARATRSRTSGTCCGTTTRREPQQLRHVRQTVAIYRALLAAGVVEQLAEPDETGRRARLTVDLQADFALNQPLSTFALAALELLDVEAPTYALDVLSVLEATLDDPRQVLARAAVPGARRGRRADEGRRDRVRGADGPAGGGHLAQAARRAAGARLRDVPAPATRGSPTTSCRPKSVVRDMHERALGFGELVNLYGLSRSEGLVLRYLADAYKALRRTVPEAMRSEAIVDLTEWLGEIVRQTDSSLLDEWEQLVDPNRPDAPAQVDAAPRPLTANTRAFTVLVRNAMFRRVELAALRRWDDLGGAGRGAPGWDAERWRDGARPVLRRARRHRHRPGRPRSAAAADREDGATSWRVRQVLDDPAGDHDWCIEAEVDLAASDDGGHRRGAGAERVCFVIERIC